MFGGSPGPNVCPEGQRSQSYWNLGHLGKLLRGHWTVMGGRTEGLNKNLLNPSHTFQFSKLFPNILLSVLEARLWGWELAWLLTGQGFPGTM